jgi:hypothetical protein
MTAADDVNTCKVAESILREVSYAALCLEGIKSLIAMD